MNIKSKFKNVLKNDGVKTKEKTKGPKLTFMGMLILIAILPLILAVFIVSVNSVTSLKSSLEKNTKDTLFVVASNLASHCVDENISYSTADKFNDYIDSLQDRNIEMAILIKGAPSVASIKNENGYRIRDIVVRDEVYADPDLDGAGVYRDNVDIDEKQYLCYYRPLYVDGELLGVVMSAMPKELIDAETRKAVMTLSIESVVMVIIMAAILLYIAKDITHTFMIITKNINNLAEGNLGRTADKKSKVRELSNLVDASRTVSDRLEEIIGEVLEASENLAEDVGTVTMLGENNAEKADSISSAMRELAGSTNEIAEYVSGISTQMNDMGDSITNISESVVELNAKSDTLINANNNAKHNIELILDSNTKAFNAVGDISSQIKETNESIANINAAVDLILGIASKTKLLSLNASIEAARAGEAGRGFAVVADEIRQLSEQSSSGAASIRDLAQTIVEKSSKSVELADEVYELMNKERESVTVAENSYNELEQNIQKSADEISMIAKKTENLTEAKQIVLENVDRLAQLSQHNAVGNQAVSSNVEEISEDAHNIFNSCDGMNKLADTLKDSISFFNI